MSVNIEELNGEHWFKIENSDSLRPFFMTVVSDSNHWLFISSNGGLTAGRKNSEYALFPYYTDDKITESAHITGSKTVFRVKKANEVSVWEPFAKGKESFDIQRNVYKNRFGNKIRFEEINKGLGLTFHYEWNSSHEYGFIKRSTLINKGDDDVEVSVLDGLQNILPYGVPSDLQSASSNLVDAYKRSELVKDTGMGIFALSAIIVDRAEPSEALKANVVWSYGVETEGYLLSSLQLDTFREGEELNFEEDVKGEKGAYFLKSTFGLGSGMQKQWSIVANVNLNHSQVIALNEKIKDEEAIAAEIAEDIETGSRKLRSLVASADGVQHTGDSLRDARHFSNVMFNIMRGGIFDDHYQIEKSDFLKYMRQASKPVYDRNEEDLKELATAFSKFELDSWLEERDDADLVRLSKEYLPLKFSRRHGDPSRPWNKFSINTVDELDGSKILDYQGNWRDLFQNWEALAWSYPHFMEGMIYKFLNATTFDGYNPYRVTKGGFDWEIIEPDDPWSYIGYWGDHQIIYLLKFLEFMEEHQPGELTSWMQKDVFVYANVPYRIKDYENIVANPKDTIVFQEGKDAALRKAMESEGADGSLLKGPDGGIYRVNFLEKILATTLAKFSNFIPEGGIWMNTQRPEWNDANNALVGNGISMVTLYYLRRFMKFMQDHLLDQTSDDIEISAELHTFFRSLIDTLQAHTGVLEGTVDDETRKEIADQLGTAASRFREQVYDHGFSGEKKKVDRSDLEAFVKTGLQYLEHSIEANRRSDNLYHAYNLLTIREDGFGVSYLDEMLEGQVAVLSSGYLNADESLSVLDGLRNSALYRKDQQSYILYPNKQLSGFLERNNIPDELVQKSELLTTLVHAGNLQIVTRDVLGGYHFNGDFKNAGDLKEGLEQLDQTTYGDLVEKERSLILQIFEEVFDHKSFTGRSGTFFGFEGLGSIYWHMVSKLYLAAYEVCRDAADHGAEDSVLNKLAHHFDEIGAGIGVHKSPELYGAFPTDAYSHTPAHKGAQQPGMTGQVKEDILVRIGELGIRIHSGRLAFEPFLLRKDEFRSEGSTVGFAGVEDEQLAQITENGLAFTVCQVPVIYSLGAEESLTVVHSDGTEQVIGGTELDEQLSEAVFRRTGEIKEVQVQLSESRLR